MKDCLHLSTNLFINNKAAFQLYAVFGGSFMVGGIKEIWGFWMREQTSHPAFSLPGWRTFLDWNADLHRADLCHLLPHMGLPLYMSFAMFFSAGTRSDRLFNSCVFMKWHFTGIAPSPAINHLTSSGLKRSTDRPSERALAWTSGRGRKWLCIWKSWSPVLQNLHVFWFF